MKRPRGTITLGSGGVLYLVVSGMIFAAAVYTQANLLFAAFGLVAGGLVVSALWSLVALRGLTVRRELPAYGVAGAPMTLRYEVTNGSRWPAFSVVVSERPDPAEADTLMPTDPEAKSKPGAVEGWLVHVGPGQSVTAEAPCWPNRRGVLRFSRVRVWTTFPFGVFRRSVWLDIPGEVLVLPRMHRLSRQLLQTTAGQDAVGTRRRNRPGTSGEFFGLRAYRAGDPPRLIDWKRSARVNRLVAREMTQPCPQRVMIRLDLSGAVPTETTDEGDASRARLAEDAITLTASLIGEAHRHGYSTGLAVAGPSGAVFAPRQGLPHRTAMLEALARLDLARSGHQPEAGIIVPSIIVRADAPARTQTPDATPSPESSSGFLDRTFRRVRVLHAAELAEYLALEAPYAEANGDPETYGPNGESGEGSPGQRAPRNGIRTSDRLATEAAR